MTVGCCVLSRRFRTLPLRARGGVRTICIRRAGGIRAREELIDEVLRCRHQRHVRRLKQARGGHDVDGFRVEEVVHDLWRRVCTVRAHSTRHTRRHTMCTASRMISCGNTTERHSEHCSRARSGRRNSSLRSDGQLDNPTRPDARARGRTADRWPSPSTPRPLAWRSPPCAPAPRVRIDWARRRCNGSALAARTAPPS